MSEQRLSEEIDLGYLVNRVIKFFRSGIKLLYGIILFFLKYWIITLVLIILGIGYGLLKDNPNKKTYQSEAIVIPNYESVDYLYAAIEEINSKIKVRDTVFLKSFLGADYKKLKRIQIEPIADIYNTMSKSREQIDVFRIIYQNQDFDKFIDNLATSKYFKYHKVSFTTAGEGYSEEIISNVFSYWNSNQHFLAYQEMFKENVAFQETQYLLMFRQIDSVIASITEANRRAYGGGVVITENNNLSELFNRKRDMMEDLLEVQTKKEDYVDIIKLVYLNAEVENLTISNSFKYPVIFVGLFALAFFLRYLFLAMRRIAEDK